MMSLRVRLCTLGTFSTTRNGIEFKILRESFEASETFLRRLTSKLERVTLKET
jgi:hypothetical protein